MSFDHNDYRKRVLHTYRGQKQRALHGAVRQLKADPQLRVPTDIDLRHLYDMPREVTDATAAQRVADVGTAIGAAAGNARLAPIVPALSALHALLLERNPDLGTAAFWEDRYAERPVAPSATPAAPHTPEPPGAPEPPEPPAPEPPATPAPPPSPARRSPTRPVPTLIVEQAAGPATTHPVVEATWPDLHPGGPVEVWHFAAEPDWTYGTCVPLATIATAGTRLTGTVIHDRGRAGVRGPVPAGLRHYLAVTSDGADVVVGARATLGICPPLLDVDAQRFHDLAVLSWVWPGPEYDVLVRWDGPAGHGERRLTRTTYRAEGGCRIPCGGGDLTVRLSTAGAAGAAGSAPWRSSEVVLDVKRPPFSVAYRVDWERQRLRRPRAVTLTFTAAEPLTLPVQVVARGGGVLPYGPDGAHILHDGPVEVGPDRLATLRLPLPPLGRHFWVRAFTSSTEVLLDDPPVNTLRGA